MNAKGKKQIVAMLTPVIQKWLEDADLNKSVADDIGYVSERTAELMAIAAVTVLEANSDSVTYAVQEGYLSH